MSFTQPANQSCRTCGEQSGLQDLGELAPTHPGAFHVSNFNLTYCPKCDSVYLEPAPTTNDLHVLYVDSVQFSSEHYTSPEQVEKMLAYYGGALRGHNLLPQSHSRVLEIGAGFAWVSRAAKDIDPTSVTVAQDLSEECATRCEWVDHYHVCPLDSMPPENSFDLISMTHVIEHLVDPKAVLKLLCSRLKKHGKLFITAPHRPKGWSPKQGIEPWKEYSYLHVPAHVTYFSLKWFELMAPQLGIRILHWDASHDDHQAFELVLERE